MDSRLEITSRGKCWDNEGKIGEVHLSEEIDLFRIGESSSPLPGPSSDRSREDEGGKTGRIAPDCSSGEVANWQRINRKPMNCEFWSLSPRSPFLYF